MLLLACLLLVGSGQASAKLLLSQSQALAIAFPGGIKAERRTAYLTEEQLDAAQKLGRVKIDSKVWTYYVGFSSQGATGYAYFDTHLVRTMTETVMIVVDPDGALRFMELLSFLEPMDYAPHPRWLDQLSGKNLEDNLFVRRGLRNMAGSSLTSQALADSARRILAIDAVLRRQKDTIGK
jgi:hypothetical protein